MPEEYVNGDARNEEENKRLYSHPTKDLAYDNRASNDLYLEKADAIQDFLEGKIDFNDDETKNGLMLNNKALSQLMNHAEFRMFWEAYLIKVLCGWVVPTKMQWLAFNLIGDVCKFRSADKPPTVNKLTVVHQNNKITLKPKTSKSTLATIAKLSGKVKDK